jgi:MYXO-CTERM domain-containing protein
MTAASKRPMRWGIFGAIVAVPALAAAGASGAPVGINMGAPVWNGVVADDARAASLGTGAHWVRVNFRLDRWTSPNDTTKHGGRTFFETYDRIVDEIVREGREVYGLVSDELIGPSGGSDPTTQAYEDAYAANVLAVIDRYKDRVRVWETINEPNDWAGGTSARVPASAFARLHARVYDEVKIKHRNDACWDVALVTGPLFAFDANSSAEFFEQIIQAGRAGGRWKSIRDATGRDPVDGIGYHLYVAQGSDSRDADVATSARANLAEMRAVMDRYALGDRKFWISELGFAAGFVGEPAQASRLDVAFSEIGTRSDVASLFWFTIVDFEPSAWGLYRGGFTPADRRPAYDRLVTQARALAPEHAAKLEVALPPSIAAGSKVVARVKATNLGRTTWTRAIDVRLGAAAGCPAAWATNGWRWDDLPASDGYVRSETDARRYLSTSDAIAQGGTVVLDVPLIAPATPGKSRFAVRLVREGVAWFGSTAWADVEIVPAGGAGGQAGSSPAGNASAASAPGDGAGQRSSAPTSPVAGSGCGCTNAPASHAPWAIGVGLAALLLARRRR